MLRRVAGGLIASAVGLVSSSASAQASGPPPDAPEPEYPATPAMLQYVLKQGAEACPTEEDFRVEVAIVRDGRRDLEFLPFDAGDRERVLVRVTLERLPGGKLQGTIEHLPPPGTAARPPRVKVNSECEDLVRDLAFPASLFLPHLARPVCTPAEPSAPPAPAPAAPPPGPPCEAPAPKPACDPDKDGDAANDEACKRLLARLEPKYGRRVDFSLLGGGLMTLVYTSDPGPGLVIGAAVQGDRWSVAIEAQATLPAPVRVSPVYDADVSTFVGLVVPCVRLGKTVVFVGCGAVGAGMYLTYDSQAPAEVVTLTTWTVRIGPRAGLEVPLGDRFAFFAWGEVSFAPHIVVLDYSPPPVSWEQSVASVFLSAGFSVRLGGGSEPKR